MTCLERPVVQTELVGTRVHTDITSGSDWPSCLEVARSLFEIQLMPITLALTWIDHAHLKRAALRSGSATGHRGSEAAHSAIPTTWILVGLNKVFSWVLCWSLTRIKSAILRKRTDQVVTFYKWAFSSLAFRLWNLRSILWRYLCRYTMGSSHGNSIAFALNWACRPSSLR